MAENHSFPTQPQIAQLECRFKGPLIKDSQVETFTDLVLLNPQFAYKHKIVWVQDEQINYYLADGDGTTPTNWKRAETRAIISAYNPSSVYQTGECVYIDGKIYSALQGVPINTSPLDNQAYWTSISGESVTTRYIFQDKASILVYTAIVNPYFEIQLCEFEKDGNNNIVIEPATGLASIINSEIVDAEVVRRYDLPANNGLPYEIKLNTDEAVDTVFYTGCINLK